MPTLDPGLLDRRVSELLGRNGWTRQQLVAFQQDRLKSILRHAAGHSSFYRETIGPLVAQDAPLDVFPTLTKTVLMANFDTLVTDPALSRRLVEDHIDSAEAGELLLGKYHALATGGSTGERGVFVYDLPAWEVAIANFLRFQRQLGIAAGVRSVRIGAPSPIHLSNRFYEELQSQSTDCPRLFVTTPIAEVVDALNAYQPAYIVSYPSFLRRLAREQLEGRLRIAPQLVRSAAEALSPDVRELAWQAWKTPVANGYATTEAGTIAVDCAHMRGMHLAEDLLVIEVVDDRNKPVPPGIQGAKVLITSLTNRTLPIIRYELSDLVTLAEGWCACGSPFRRIASIEGRREEVLHFRTSDGKTVQVHAARLWFHLVKIAGIRQYQFAQMPDGIQVKLAIHPDYDVEEVRAAAKAIVDGVMIEMGIESARTVVEIADEIARVGTGAKERLVSSIIPFQ